MSITLPSVIAAPFRVLLESVRGVPAVKYALGVAGVVSVVSLVAGLGVDQLSAVIGAVIMIVLMTVLLVFAKLSVAAAGVFRAPMLVLLWASIVLFCAVAVLLCSSVFFRWPLPLDGWLTKAQSPRFASSERSEVDVAVRRIESWKLPPGHLYRSINCELRVVNLSDLDVPIDPDAILVVSGDDGALRAEFALEVTAEGGSRGSILNPRLPTALFLEGQLAASGVELLGKGHTAFVQLFYDRSLSNKKHWYISPFFNFDTSVIQLLGD